MLQLMISTCTEELWTHMTPHSCLTPIGVQARESALKPDALPSLSPIFFTKFW